MIHISPSGKTLIPYNNKSLYPCHVLLLNKSVNNKDNLVHRYDEYICMNDVIDIMKMNSVIILDNETNISPNWYENFCSLSR